MSEKGEEPDRIPIIETKPKPATQPNLDPDEFNIDEYDFVEDEPILSRENALQILKPFLKRCGVDTKKIRDKEKKERIVNMIDVVCQGIMDGRLEIEEIEGEYQVIQHLKIRSPGSTIEQIVFGEYTGKTHRKMDSDKSQLDQALSLMEHLSKTPNAKIIIDKIRSSDLDLLEALSTFFL